MALVQQFLHVGFLAKLEDRDERIRPLCSLLPHAARRFPARSPERACERRWSRSWGTWACNLKPSASITLRIVSKPGLRSPERALSKLLRGRPTLRNLCHAFRPGDIAECPGNERRIVLSLFEACSQVGRHVFGRSEMLGDVITTRCSFFHKPSYRPRASPNARGGNVVMWLHLVNYGWFYLLVAPRMEEMGTKAFAMALRANRLRQSSYPPTLPAPRRSPFPCVPWRYSSNPVTRIVHEGS